MENIKVSINGFEYFYSKTDLLKIPYFQTHEKYNKNFINGKEIKIYNKDITPNSLNDLINYINHINDINGSIQNINDPLFHEKVQIAALFYGYPLLETTKNQTRLFT